MSGVGIAQEGSEDREYLLRLFYMPLTRKVPYQEIHVVISWNLKEHLTAIEDEYSKKGVLPGPHQVVEFEADTISLDIPMEGITIKGWKITPLMRPVVTKKQVDNFREGKLAPCFQLLAEVSGKKKNIPTLKHQVNLKGAKYPNDVFVINLPAGGMYAGPSYGESSSTPHAVTDDKPELKDLLSELFGKVANEWEEIGIQLEIEYSQLEYIRSDNAGDSIACLHEMLRVWLSRVAPPPSWSEMADALDMLGHEDIATHLRSTYCPPKKQSRLEDDQHSSDGPSSASGLDTKLSAENMKHFEAYQLALQGEEGLLMRYLKFLLFGPPRSGKSSTRRRLIKEIHNLRSIGGVSNSTGLAHSSEILIKKMTCSPAAIIKSVDGGDLEWKLLKGPQTGSESQDEKKADLKYLAQVFYNFIVRKAPSSNSQVTTHKQHKGITNNPSSTLNQEQMQESGSDILDSGYKIETELSDGNIDKAFEELTHILQSDSPEELQQLVENLVMINVMDIGGQPAFLEILPTFTIGSALYLLFFRMDQDPKKLYPVRFKEHENDEETILDSFYCIEDVLCQSLSCVASLGYTQSSSDQQSISRALLFGTYKDEVEKQGNLETCVSKINKELWGKLSNIKKDVLLTASRKENFFQVDNMDGNDDINEIRKVIEKIVQKVYPSIPVPPSWLMFRILLHLLDKPVISFNQCKAVASKFMMSTPVEEAVWFFHHHVGSLMHFPEIESMKNVVICNPQVIFDSISEVIISTFNIRNRKIPESAVEEFKLKGRFTFEHIECSSKEQRQSCLSPSQLIDVLKYHNVIAEIKTENDEHSQSSPKYIIPAVLSCASEEDLKLLEGERSESSACPLMIRFECGFVPLGIFCAGVSYLIAHQQEKDWILHKNHEVKKNKVTFLVEGTYIVTFISRPQYLEIHVVTLPHASRNRKSLPEMCFTVKQTIIGALNTVILQMKHKTMFQRSGDPFFHLSIAFTCTCGTNNDGHLMKVIENKSGKCLHVESRHDLQGKHLVWFGESESPLSVDTSSGGSQMHCGRVLSDPDPQVVQTFGDLVTAADPPPTKRIKLDKTTASSSQGYLPLPQGQGVRIGLPPASFNYPAPVSFSEVSLGAGHSAFSQQQGEGIGAPSAHVNYPPPVGLPPQPGTHTGYFTGPQQPISVTRLTGYHLASLLQQLTENASSWRVIGTYLGFRSGELDNIQNNLSLFSTAPVSWLSAMLTQWLQWAPGDSRGSTSFATLEDLKVALNQARLGATAHDLKV